MSGRPPPPLPPSASEPCAPVDRVEARGEIAGDADHDAGLAVLGDADDGDHAGADLLLAVVDQALEILGLDAFDRARQQLDVADFAHAACRRSAGTAKRRRPSRASCAHPTDRAPASCALPSARRCAPACRRAWCEAPTPRSSRAPWCRWRACAHECPVSASMRRTPEATALSPVTEIRPISPVRRTWVPPHSSTDQPSAFCPCARAVCPSKPRGPRRRIFRRTARVRRPRAHRPPPSGAW